MTKLDQIASRNISDEPGYLEVAMVYFEQEGSVWCYGAFIVTKVGPVCGADFDQLSATLGHHLRHAKRTTDLDQLPARHDDLLPPCQSGQCQQDRCRIVCDSEGGFSAREAHQEGLYVLVPYAPTA
jgi:hypothetical protein